MKIPDRVQWILIALLVIAAIAFAIPAMHNSNIAKSLRGECGPPAVAAILAARQNTYCSHTKMANPTGEADRNALRLDFDHRLHENVGFGEFLVTQLKSWLFIDISLSLRLQFWEYLPTVTPTRL